MAKPVGSSTTLRNTASSQISESNTHTFFRLHDNNGILRLISDDGVEIAVLDVQTTSKLQVLNHIAGTRYEAVVELRNIVKRKSKSQEPFDVTINILGPLDSADEVSLALSKAGVFLQHPEALDTKIDYFNPDILVFPGHEPMMREYIGVGTATGKQKHRIRDIEEILGSLGQDPTPGGAELYPLHGLKSALKKSVYPPKHHSLLLWSQCRC